MNPVARKGLIMPIFALAHAGVNLGGDLLGSLTGSISLGIAVGLILGKQLGIALFSWLAVRLGLAALPEGVTWRHIYVASCLAGIGSTMSIFIAGLAFAYTPELGVAKIGILAASLIAGLSGWLILRRSGEAEPVLEGR
jgi:NhaA family Na+:H+ antiporter